MKRNWAIFLCILLMLMISSCATGYIPSEDYEEEDDMISFEGSFENDDFTIAVSANYEDGIVAKYLVLTVNNRGNVPIIVDLNKSAYVGVMSSQRMIDGETRVINSNLAQPLFTVAPKSFLTRMLFDSSQSGFLGNSGDLNVLNPRVSLCLTIDGKDQFFDIELKKPVKIEQTETKEVIGQVEFSTIKLYPLFIGSNSKAAIKEAKKEAVKKFGEGVKVENIRYEANWNPLSLLLYFDALGQFRNIKGTADVVRITN